MRLVTYEPAVGCQRLGALVGGKVVDLVEVEIEKIGVLASVVAERTE